MTMKNPILQALWLCLSCLMALPGQADEATMLLVAREGMPDRNFSQTVVLVTRHGRQGTVGLVLNRQLPMALKVALPGFPSLAAREDRLHFGGPVSPQSPVFLVQAASPPPQALQVVAGVYLSNSPEGLQALLEQSPLPLRFRVFAGFASWAPGQLERELRRGDWHALPAELDEIFNAGGVLQWQRLQLRAKALSVQGPAGSGQVSAAAENGAARGLFAAEHDRFKAGREFDDLVIGAALAVNDALGPLPEQQHVFAVAAAGQGMLAQMDAVAVVAERFLVHLPFHLLVRVISPAADGRNTGQATDRHAAAG